MKRRNVPTGQVLDLWAAGKNTREIIEIIGPVNGAKFSRRAIEVTLRNARLRGDQRAVTRMITGPKGSIVLADPQSQK